MNEWDERSFDWELPEDAVIVEVGGFAGRWVTEMWKRYPGSYYVYEPQHWALARCHDALRALGVLPGKRTLTLEPYGLGVGPTAYVSIGGYHTDAASILKTPEWFEQHPGEGRTERDFGYIQPVEEELGPIGRIDVMCMNIEGYEFLLLPEMVRLGLVKNIRNLMVQFHADYDVPVDELQVRDMLSETHRVLWDYPALTAWRLRDG